jgi:DNA-binding NtrC family response regulator
MKGQCALLLDVGTNSQLSESLQNIIEPYFQVHPGRPSRVLGNELNGFRRELVRFIHSSNPKIIFLVLPCNLEICHTTVIEAIREEARQVPLIVVVAAEVCEPQHVFQLLKVGAADFITSPFTVSDVLPRTWRLIRQYAEKQERSQLEKTEPGLRELLGESPDFITQAQKIPIIAKCDANVLIAGETGTDKEVFARAIHYCSERAGKPFVPVNCGAIPVELVENELFGHERGAFTTAVALQAGLIEEANGGTLFLDEIDCLPVLAQVKLLRFLQEKEYRPLGAARLRRADVRIIAASNLNLEEAVGNGRVRKDLFYRLNIISFTLPPLRERREDIALLAHHFLTKYSSEFNKDVDEFTPDAVHRLIVYSWPGNVRELEHVIERAVVLCEGSTLKASDIVLSSQHDDCQESLQEAKAREIARFEKNYIKGLLRASGGNITRAAHAAQKNRRAFWQLIQKHRIDVEQYKAVLP